MCSKFVPRRKGNMVLVVLSANGTFGEVSVITKDLPADTIAGVSKPIL